MTGSISPITIGAVAGTLFALAIVILHYVTTKKETPVTTPTTPIAPATTPATPATPSGGWKSWIVPVVIILALFVAGYWLYANGYFKDPIDKLGPKIAPEKEKLTAGCSAAVLTSTGYEYLIRFDENGYSGFGGCDQFNETKMFSLEVVKGEIKYWDGKTSSVFNASGVIDPQSGYKQPTAESLPLGVLLVGVDANPYLELGSKKIFFKVNNGFLEAYDKKDNGKLLRKIPVTLPAQPGGWSSQLKLLQNARCWEKAPGGKPVCTATFEVRQIYYTK